MGWFKIFGRVTIRKVSNLGTEYFSDSSKYTFLKHDGGYPPEYVAKAALMRSWGDQDHETGEAIDAQITYINESNDD